MGQGSNEIGAHELGAGIAHLRVLFDGPKHDIVESRGDGGVQILRRRRRLGKVHQRRSHRGVADEGHGAGEHLVEGDAGGVDIAFLRHGQALGLFGGYIVYGTDHIFTGEGHGAGGDLPGDAEVGQLGLAPVGDDHVLGLHIPVDDPVGVGVGKGVQDLAADTDGLLHRQMAPGALLDQLLQGLALHVLQDDVGHTVVVPHAEGADDVLMGQGQARFGFPLEAAQELPIVQVFLLQHLHGHDLAGGHVDGPIDVGHAAAAHLADDAILAVDDIRRHSSTPPSLRTSTREMLSALPLS